MAWLVTTEEEVVNVDLDDVDIADLIALFAAQHEEDGIRIDLAEAGLL